MLKKNFFKLGVLVSVLGGCFIFFSNSALAATCSVSSALFIDQTYITNNSCDTLNLSGTFTVTWSTTTTIDLVGDGNLNVQSGTVTFENPLVLGSTDDMTIDSGVTVDHAA